MTVRRDPKRTLIWVGLSFIDERRVVRTGWRCLFNGLTRLSPPKKWCNRARA